MKNSQQLLLNAALFSLLAGSLSSCQGEKQENKSAKEVTAPSQIVSIPKAKMLYETYGKRRVQLIQHYEDSINSRNEIEKKFDVARYVHYDYKVIKQYLNYIEQEAKAAKVDISTLRIYFSNYPEDDDNVNHPRQNSVMLSPTLNSKGEEYLFYIDDSMKEAPKAVLLDWDFGTLKNNDMGSILSRDKSSQAALISGLGSPNKALPLATYDNGISLTLNRGNSAPPPPYN